MCVIVVLRRAVSLSEEQQRLGDAMGSAWP